MDITCLEAMPKSVYYYYDIIRSVGPNVKLSKWCWFCSLEVKSIHKSGVCNYMSRLFEKFTHLLQDDYLVYYIS